MLERYKFGFIFLFFIFLATLIFFSSSGKINDMHDSNRNIFRFFPANYSFFARKSIRTTYTLYKLEGNRIIKVSTKNNSSENLFGLSRKSRKIDTEKYLMLDKVRDLKWEQHSNRDALKLNKQKFYVKKTEFNNYLTEGEYLFVKREIPAPDVSGALLDKITYESLDFFIIK